MLHAFLTMFVSELIKVDVTAIKLLDHHILAGIGNYLNIFDISGNFIRKAKIFDGQKIHGIIVDGKNLLLFGGCHLHTLEYNTDSSSVVSLHSKQINDWILTAQWLKQDTFAVVVMKNKLVIYDQSLNKLREYICREECMLYSAFITYNEEEEEEEEEDSLVILSGTVFGKILVWKTLALEKDVNCPVLVRLTGHNGVIFSVHYNRKSAYICSSSDDRSTILWSPKTGCIHEELRKENPDINPVRKYYGHQSRIFRSFLTDQVLLTAGEDSIVNVWNFQGELLNKIPTNQGGPVWALDAHKNTVISGGGGCGILKSSIDSADSINCHLRVPDGQIPKRIAFLNDGNLIVCTESGEMYHYSDAKERWLKIKQREDLKSYCLLEVSECRKLFALAGYRGEIHIYQSRNDAVELVATSQTGRKSRICSFHWLTCQTFLTCEESGTISLFFFSNDQEIIFITNFNLPTSSNLWSTSACQMDKGLFVIGDRRGNIYLYELKSSTPIQILKKVHSHLGITRLLNLGKKIRTLGRDGIVKTFFLDDGKLKLCSSDKIPFIWLADLVDSNLLLAFSGKCFVVWDYQTRRILLEHLCGGGHRSWDFIKRNGSVIFSYVKERTINVVKWEEEKCLPKNISAGYHANTINTVCFVKSFRKRFILASGSEDTTLRIITVGRDKFSCVENYKSHLSSIKTMCLHKITENSWLLFSGGGRGQIICWKVFLEEQIECHQEYSHYKEADEKLLESEFRIMDLKVLHFQDDLLLFSACSDGNVNIFKVQKIGNQCRLYHLRTLFHKVKCISKISLIGLTNFHILIAMSTDGNVTFWNVSRISDMARPEIIPLKIIKNHQSGIVSCCYRLLDDNLLLFITGGDDACIVANLFQITTHTDSADFVTLSNFRDCSSHCAQVSGIWIGQDRFLTTSIDQKLLLFEWHVDESRCLYMNKLAKYNSAVADIQGMECAEDRGFFHVFLYGKGVEYVKVEKNKII